MDLGPLLKLTLIRAFQSDSSVLLPNLTMQDAFLEIQASGEGKIHGQPISIPLDNGGLAYSELDMAFFRLFLTFNPYENARHELSYDISSRWSINCETRDRLLSDIIVSSPDSVYLYDFTATFDETAQIRKRHVQSEPAENVGASNVALYFTISRKVGKTWVLVTLDGPTEQEQ